MNVKRTTIYDYCKAKYWIFLQIKCILYGVRNLPSKRKSWRLMMIYVIVNQPNDSHHGCLGWVVGIENKRNSTMHWNIHLIFP